MADFMKGLTNTEKGALCLLVVIATMFFFDRILYTPAVMAHRRAVSTRNSLKQEIARHSVKEDPQAFEAKLRDQRNLVESLEAEFENCPLAKADTEAEVTGLVTEISNRAERRGLQLVSLSPGNKLCHSMCEELQGKDLKTMPVVKDPEIDFFDWREYAIEFEGRYLDAVGFLDDLRELPSAMLVKSVNVAIVPDSYGRVRLKLNMLF